VTVDFFDIKAQLKDTQHDVEAMTLARDEAVSTAKESDKKLKMSEAELLQLQADLASSERARKAAQSERDDLLEELNSGSSTRLLLCLNFKQKVVFVMKNFRMWGIIGVDKKNYRQKHRKNIIG